MRLLIRLLLFLLLLSFSSSSIPSASSSSLSSNPSSPICPLEEWEKISTTQMMTAKDDENAVEVFIDTYTKKNEGTTLLSFRGDAMNVPVHISDAVAHFENLTLSFDWIDLLKEIREISNDVVYQRLRMPWPVSDRDLLLRKEWIFDKHAKLVNVSYYSFLDEEADRIVGPPAAGVIRAFNPLTRWIFRSAGDGSGFTDISVESTVDSRGSIPAFVVNYFQRRWPSKALGDFYNLVKTERVQPRSDLIDW